MTDRSAVELPTGKLPMDLLSELLKPLAQTSDQVLIGPGIGHDAAVVRPDEELIVLKSDPITFSTEKPAHHLVHVNANDIACMGATPRWLLVTALCPAGQTTREEIETIFEELQHASRSIGVELVGGHTEITGAVNFPVLIGMMVGTTNSARLIQPGASKPGDRILMTKAIAIEGTALIAHERSDELAATMGAEFVERAKRLLFEPGISVVSEANILAGIKGVKALHDPTEGGLATGIRELAAASHCGARVAPVNVAILEETRQIAGYYGIDPLGLLASGSLLAVVEPGAVPTVETALNEAGLDCCWLGKLAPESAGFSFVGTDGETEMPVFATDEVAKVLA